MAVLKHRHTYERSKETMEVYRCVHPQCSHFNRRSMIVGKEISCYVCHQPTLARQEQLRSGQVHIGVKRLTCIGCSKSPKRFEIQAIENVLTGILEEVNELPAMPEKEEEPKSA